MAGAPPSPNTGTGKIVPTPGSSNSPSNSPAFMNAERTTYNDLNSGNYADAWKTALGTSSMFGTGMSATTKDPLLQALETSQGLNAFDPSKKWDANSLNQYYSAFNNTGAYHGNNSGSNGFLGKNPYGVWGNASAITSGADQKANMSQEGMTPDVARFAGARPAPTFMQKWGKPTLEVAGMVAAGLLAPEAIGGISSLMDAGLTSGVGASLGGGAFLGSAAGGILEGGAAGALYGAGTGAAIGAIGGNAGRGAELGAIGGGVMGGVGAAGNYLGTPGGVNNMVGNLASNFAKNAAVGGGGSGGGTYGVPGAGGQGNNGNMASTDSTLAGTITGALPGVLQAGATGGASMAGANAQVGALNNAITTQKSTLGNISNIWQPQQSLGVGADTSLGNALGTNGKPADYSGFENMPGYQFAIKQGTQAIDRQAAAMGNAYTPNTAAAVGQYVTGTAMQDYNTYINQLMGAAGLGSTANTQLGSANLQTGENISGLQQNIGQARAGGYKGVGSGVSGLFSPNGAGTSLIGAAGRYLFGGNGNGGGNSGGSSGGGNSGGGNYGGGYDPTMNGGSNSNYGSAGLYGDNTGSTTDINNITGGVNPGSFGGVPDMSNVGNIDLSGTGSSAGDWLSGFDTGGGDGGATDFLTNGFSF